MGRKGREVKAIAPKKVERELAKKLHTICRPLNNPPELFVVQNPVSEHRFRSYQRRSFEKNRRRKTGKLLSRKRVLAQTELYDICPHTLYRRPY